MGIAISGLTADARVLCRYMRNECLNHRRVFARAATRPAAAAAARARAGQRPRGPRPTPPPPPAPRPPPPARQVRVRVVDARGPPRAPGRGQAPGLHAALVEAPLRRRPARGRRRPARAAPVQHLPQRQLLGVQGDGHRRALPGARRGRRGRPAARALRPPPAAARARPPSPAPRPPAHRHPPPPTPQASKTYLEKHFETFGGATQEELILHGLRALAASLSEGELTKANCAVSVVGEGSSFVVIEDDDIEPYIQVRGAGGGAAGRLGAGVGVGAAAAVGAGASVGGARLLGRRGRASPWPGNPLATHPATHPAPPHPPPPHAPR